MKSLKDISSSRSFLRGFGAYSTILIALNGGCVNPGGPDNGPPPIKLDDPIPYDSLGSGILVFQRENLFFLNAGNKTWSGLRFGNAQPVVAPNGLKIAYSGCIECSFSSGGYEIFLMNVDGSTLENLSALGVGSFSANPHWVGDSAVVYSTGPTVYVQRVSGPREKKAIYSFPSASMGSVEVSAAAMGKLAVTFNKTLYVMDLDGTNVKVVATKGGTDFPEQVHAPAISPDGTQIAYLHSTWTPNRTELILASVDGTVEEVLFSVGSYHQLVHTNGASLLSVCWSPDGSRIAFTMPVLDESGSPGSFSTHMYVVKRDGTGLTRVTSLAGQNDTSLSWF